LRAHALAPAVFARIYFTFFAGDETSYDCTSHLRRTELAFASRRITLILRESQLTKTVSSLGFGGSLINHHWRQRRALGAGIVQEMLGQR